MKLFYYLNIIFIIIISCICYSQNTSGILVKVDKNSGEYTISSTHMNWNFTGNTGHKLTRLDKIKGKDAAGIYTEIIFNWSNKIRYKGTIKWYRNKPVVLFTLALPEGSDSNCEAFPSFKSFPQHMHKFSYFDDVFAPPQFKLNETSTPWLFFDDHMNSFIISPASDFIVSRMIGNGTDQIASGINAEVKNLPSNFIHTTILVFTNGIRKAWDIWGEALRSMYKRKIPANDSDPVLKYYGYWTDNGADYYYNYDTTLGYSKTLNALRERYENEGIPLGYMQLDSWWYEKSIYDPNGKPDADHKNPNLPFGEWNRYGGMISYTADPFLFPKGLFAFHQELGIPLVTHNRWIDPTSLYHNKYKISGYAAVDTNYWAHIVNYIKSSGVVCYEQDWLNFIYNKSPDMISDLKVGNEFTDDMANACLKYGLSMQYCMAMPRFFLQGLKYNNLTTIRTSGDRFEPSKWEHFLYTSQLAYECGIYPWCDVFKSSEKGNMILSVLSDGPVGTGDAIGKEVKSNIMLACRQDGVLVKPDEPILPIDEDYINEANKIDSPMLAFTYTKHGNIKTGYVFAFSNKKTKSSNLEFNPNKLGIKGNVVVYNPITDKIKTINKGEYFKDEIPNNSYTYYIVAPITSSGIAFLGDTNKITATGKERISKLNSERYNIKVRVLFAQGESNVNLKGYSESLVKSDKGKIVYNPSTHIFNLYLPSRGKSEVSVSIRKVMSLKN